MSVYDGYYAPEVDKNDEIGTIIWPTLPDLPKIKKPHFDWIKTKKSKAGVNISPQNRINFDKIFHKTREDLFKRIFITVFSIILNIHLVFHEKLRLIFISTFKNGYRSAFT